MMPVRPVIRGPRVVRKKALLKAPVRYDVSGMQVGRPHKVRPLRVPLVAEHVVDVVAHFFYLGILRTPEPV